MFLCSTYEQALTYELKPTCRLFQEDFVAMTAVLPRGPILGLCRLPMAVRCLIARFLAPRLRRCVHPMARVVRDLVFHVELPRRLVVFWRWEHRLWLAGSKPIRPAIVWPWVERDNGDVCR